ncbi:NAD-dependent epimerase/dehydratase family protein, partial [Candidatus Acetothermia bacterium]|nr:NAD-dependent epimerase/dehydratase family protein [Candidatus Acetothermia bacterium]
GRHLVEAALASGHTVTLFNRGQHNADLYPNVEKLRGNRDGDLNALKGRRWDAVIDTCGYVPRVVKASAEFLANSVDHYTFISSISVFADFSKPDMDESAPVGKLKDESVEQITGETYGPLKALCEQAAERAMPGRMLNVRPGLIVGPHDPSDRFTYWPARIAQGGEVLAPGQPEYLVQIIDGRDLAQWTLKMVEQKKIGIYNATGPEYALTLGTVLEGCKAVSKSDARFVWVDEKFLLESKVTPWTEIPLWVPQEKDNAGFSAVNCQKAITAGLKFRPIAETIRDTLAWNTTRPSNTERRSGLKPEKEKELLQNWQKRSKP